MRVTISQIDGGALESQWPGLIQHCRAEKSDFLLLPEMCFSPWFCAAPDPDERIWDAAVSAHDRWLSRLPELGVPMVSGTAPRRIEGQKRNASYVWTSERGLQWHHQKTYLPDEAGFWEATWYDRGAVDFPTLQIGGLRLGVMICTEMWFLQHARAYGQRGIHLLLSPRSTPLETNDKWLAGGRTAAVVSGAYCLSSNHAGRVDDLELGGCGWLCDPEGRTLALTSDEQPFATVAVDLKAAEDAKRGYPRYVDDSPL